MSKPPAESPARIYGSVITVRFTVPVLAEARRIARERGRGISAWVRELVEDAVQADRIHGWRNRRARLRE